MCALPGLGRGTGQTGVPYRDLIFPWARPKGVAVEEVSKLLGHESIKTTERRYSKWVKERLDRFVSATWKK